MPTLNKTHMKRRLRGRQGPLHIEYALHPEEISSCSICGCPEDRHYHWSGYTLVCRLVPAGRRFPFAGVIGLCCGCRKQFGDQVRAGMTYRDSSTQQERVWSPVEWVRPIAGQPLYLILRGCCDEKKLATAIEETWQRIPATARSIIHEHCRTSKEEDTCIDGPIRIEALPKWPRSHRCWATCLAGGHAIRIVSTIVNTAPPAMLSHLLAHELGHTFQHATGSNWSRPKRVIEQEVKEIIDGWGFKDKLIKAWSIKEALRRAYTWSERE